MEHKRYRQVQNFLKLQIQKGQYTVGDYLPSENELCATFTITRTTARKALDELTKEGFIERIHGKGSLVKERRHSLGLLNVKGFSEAAGNNVQTQFIDLPKITSWTDTVSFLVSQLEMKDDSIHFSRIRSVNEFPVMVEYNWLSCKMLPEFTSINFIDGSFFKTLSQHYRIEIIGSEQELRAEFANEIIASLLQITIGSPVLHISIKFHTSKKGYFIYSELFCNTTRYPVGNSYHI